MDTLKDVLHFYLGCEVENMPYLPNDGKKVIGKLVGINHKYGTALIQNYSIDGEPWGDIFKYPIVGSKPLLRPLSDMTKPEATELIKLSEFGLPIKEIITITALGVYFSYGSFEMDRKLTMSFDELHPAQFQWLLKNSFDLFSLIESGQAISKPKN